MHTPMVGLKKAWVTHGEGAFTRVANRFDSPVLTWQVTVQVGTSRAFVADLERGIVLDVENGSGHVG